MGIRRRVRHQFQRLGYEITRIDSFHEISRHRNLLKHRNIGLVIDVGANTGQYAFELRQLGYTGEIVSFEPTSEAFKTLRSNCERDQNWAAYQCALGDVSGRMDINVAKNSVSSSFRDMLDSHLSSAPESRLSHRESVEVKTLDEIFDDIHPANSNVMLKLDTQGYEDKVLKGAEQSLSKISMIQLEASLTPLYDGEMLIADTITELSSKSFVPVNIIPGFSDTESGRLFQVDIVFWREEVSEE